MLASAVFAMNDLRYALRSLAKSPGFTAVAVLTLALGIGACTAMFSLVNAVLLRPLPFREPDRLVWIENVFGGGLSGRTTRVDTFNGWRAQSQSFESLAAYFAFFDYGRQTMAGSGDPERLRSVGVSDNFLPTLGVRLLHGRNFTAEECAWNGPARRSSATRSGSAVSRAMPPSSAARSRSTTIQPRSSACCLGRSTSMPFSPRAPRSN
jgi:hypothetical protein